MRRSSLFLSIVALSVVLLRCSSGTLAPTGSVRVFLTDAPLDLSGVEAVNVSIEQMLLFRAGAEEGEAIVMDLAGGGAGLTLNLLDFQGGKVTFVAEASAPAGEFLKVRLVIASAELVRDDGDPATPEVVDPIFVPSGKVDVPRPFTLAAGEGMDLTLDFDASLSVQVNEAQGQQEFILRPVITPVSAVPR